MAILASQFTFRRHLFKVSVRTKYEFHMILAIKNVQYLALNLRTTEPDPAGKSFEAISVLFQNWSRGMGAGVHSDIQFGIYEEIVFN